MSPNQITVDRYMEGFRLNDHDAILACLTDDVEWLVPGAFHVGEGGLRHTGQHSLPKGSFFVQLMHSGWDQHSNLKHGHEQNALAVDQPFESVLFISDTLDLTPYISTIRLSTANQRAWNDARSRTPPS